ncbi:hypothetical protein ACFQ3N_11560 [Virgibacillus byunsanensis]|uniref:Uncharacterized protein n=1 Tax=Virgibacillus byunsanensis TaxID=570945 RepID=A0ABW3LKV9_9BACI
MDQDKNTPELATYTLLNPDFHPFDNMFTTESTVEVPLEKENQSSDE